MDGALEDQPTHCVDPKAGLRGDHEHASRLRMDVVARVLWHEHPNVRFRHGWDQKKKEKKFLCVNFLFVFRGMGSQRGRRTRKN